MEAYKHSFDGQCKPDENGVNGFTTFSVGVFQMVPKESKNGLKRTPAKVRVKGKVSEAEKVYHKAREICQALDAGTYSGPKNVIIK